MVFVCLGTPVTPGLNNAHKGPGSHGGKAPEVCKHTRADCLVWLVCFIWMCAATCVCVAVSLYSFSRLARDGRFTRPTDTQKGKTDTGRANTRADAR